MSSTETVTARLELRWDGGDLNGRPLDVPPGAGLDEIREAGLARVRVTAGVLGHDVLVEVVEPSGTVTHLRVTPDGEAQTDEPAALATPTPVPAPTPLPPPAVAPPAVVAPVDLPQPAWVRTPAALPAPAAPPGPPAPSPAAGGQAQLVPSVRPALPTAAASYGEVETATLLPRRPWDDDAFARGGKRRPAPGANASRIGVAVVVGCFVAVGLVLTIAVVTASPTTTPAPTKAAPSHAGTPAAPAAGGARVGAARPAASAGDAAGASPDWTYNPASPGGRWGVAPFTASASDATPPDAGTAPPSPPPS